MGRAVQQRIAGGRAAIHCKWTTDASRTQSCCLVRKRSRVQPRHGLRQATFEFITSSPPTLDPNAVRGGLPPSERRPGVGHDDPRRVPNPCPQSASQRVLHPPLPKQSALEVELWPGVVAWGQATAPQCEDSTCATIEAWESWAFESCARTHLNLCGESKGARRSTSRLRVGSRPAWCPPRRNGGSGGMRSPMCSPAGPTQTGSGIDS